MKQYLYSIVVISVISALLRVLCPDSTSVRKYFSFLTSAALLCATVVPISGLISGINEVELWKYEKSINQNYSAVWLESISATTKEECEAAICSFVCKEFDVTEKNVSVECKITAKDEGLHLSKIEITLYSGALLKNPRQIESLVSQEFSVECTVVDGGIRSPE